MSTEVADRVCACGWRRLHSSRRHGVGTWAWHRFTVRVRLALIARRFALPLVVAYCGLRPDYLSSANAKSERVRAYYASLHPLLRVALSTLLLSIGTP